MKTQSAKFVLRLDANEYHAFKMYVAKLNKPNKPVISINTLFCEALKAKHPTIFK